MFADFLELLIESRNYGRIVNRVSISSGDIGISTRLFAKCDCLGVSTSGVEYSCSNCGREPGKYLWAQSGDGAGHYPLIEIFSDSNEPLAALVIFDSPLASSSTIQLEISTGKLPTAGPFDLAKLARFGDLKALNLGRLESTEQVLVGDVLKLNDQDKLFASSNLKDGTLQLVAFCEPMGKTDLARPDNYMPTSMPDSPRPRIFAIISGSLRQTISTHDEITVDNWPEQIFAWRTSMVSTEIPVSSSFPFPPGSVASKGELQSPAGAAFCTQCGAQFLRIGQKFCQMCGVASAQP